MEARVQRIPVLVVGGGVAGLTAALFLAQQGVRTILVERHETTNVHPRARGLNGRSMELMRELGLADAIRLAGEKLAPAIGIHAGESLVSVLAKSGGGGFLVRRMRARGMRGRESKKSPTSPCRCTQDELEPILLRAARDRGVDARLGTELVTFAQDDDGVLATIRDRATSRETNVRAQYMIAADGARSAIRTELGISRSGSRTFGHQVNVLFRADLAELVRGREFSLCLVENDAVRGLIASIDNASTWVIHISYDRDRESPEDFTRARCEALVRKAIGKGDLAVEIRGVSPWQSAVRVAERFRRGRVFLAGDAAHSMPPWGGLGANTAMQDVHNLAWKLSLVLAGAADPSLLDTYEVERMPVARVAGEISGSMNGDRGLIAIGKGLGIVRTMWSMRRVFPYLTMGYGYDSFAIVREGRAAGPQTTALDGRPGTRLPHVWIERDGKRVSTLDLVRGRFVLFAALDADAWCAEARRAGESLHVTIDVIRLAEHDALGMRAGGAMLVRPDGIVAWRARRRSAPLTLDDALRKILGHAITEPLTAAS